MKTAWFYTIHANTGNNSAYLIGMVNGHGVLHTGSWIQAQISMYVS